MEEFTKELDALTAAGEWDRAEALLTGRLDRAAGSGNTARELSLCSELLGFYRMRNDPEGFSRIFSRTMVLLETASMPRATRGTILVNAATGLVAFGRAEEALGLYKQAETLLRAALPRGDFRLAALCNNLSSADSALGRVNLAQLYASEDPGDPRIGDCLQQALAWLDQPEMTWNEYYAHTARKCAGGFEALGRRDEAAELRERAELIYAGT